MELKKEDEEDILANLSALTVSMSIDDTGDITAADSLQAHDSSDSDDNGEKISTPPAYNRILDSRSPSPVPESFLDSIQDPAVAAFNNLAAELVNPEILNSDAKFCVVLASNGTKHRFSRNWVSKRSISSVVERPERLKAACIGIGLAKRHAPFRLVRSTGQSSLYSKHFEAVHGKDWATELYALCSNAPKKLAQKKLEVPENWPYYDVYLAPETATVLEGNIKALEIAVDEIFKDSLRRSFVVLRPPGHHCHEDAASGFCIINNSHIAIQYAKTHHQISHAVILDFDLHHGDGSQDLVWKLGFKTEGPADLPIGYFSLHDINSFPCEAGYAQPEQLANASVCFVAHHCAIWNTHLKSYRTSDEFDKIYESDYSILFRKAAEFLKNCRASSLEKGQPFRPLVVVSAGFDGSEFETASMQRHQVNVPTSFFNRFTRDCVALAENFGEGYLISMLEGGYSPAAVATGVFSHLTGLAELNFSKDWCTPATTPSEIDGGMRQRWRPHLEKWSSSGIQLGRTLFPMLELPSGVPKPSKENSNTSDHKHNLRERNFNWIT